MSPDINDPKKFKSANRVLGDVEKYMGPFQKIGYIEQTIKSLEKGDIVTVDDARLKLGDLARALYENAELAAQRSLSTKMRYIAETTQEFARAVNADETVKTYTEFLEHKLVSPKDSRADERVKELKKATRSYSGDLSARVAIYAGIASAVLFFSASSITGKVTLEDASTITSSGALAIGIGIIVFGAFAFFSRKR